MATDIIARGMITEYKSGTNVSFTENEDGSVTISLSENVSSEDTVARDAIDNHKSDTSNPHNVTPAQIGLGNVDNTADLDKPISTAVQTALDDKANTEHTHKKSDITDFPISLPANGGNADTVGGVGIAKLRQITQTLITTLPAVPSGEGDYLVVCDDTTFPYRYGHLSIRYGSYTGEYVATYRTTGIDNKIYYNTYLTNHWSGWREILMKPV